MALTARETEWLSDTHDRVVSLDARFEAIENKAEVNRRAIFGNSGWGLKANVRLLMWLVGVLTLVVSGAALAVVQQGLE